MNQLTKPEDQQAVIHAAKRFYRLYGDIFKYVAAQSTASQPLIAAA